MRQLIQQNKLLRKSISFRNLDSTTCNPGCRSEWSLFSVVLLFALLFFSTTFVSAASAPAKRMATFSEYLLQEKTHLTNEIQETKHLIAPKNEQEYLAKMEQISSVLKMTRIKIASLEGFLEQSERGQNHLNQRLKVLQQLPIAKEGATIPERVAKIEALITINLQAIELINDNLILAKEFESALHDEEKQLSTWYEHFVLKQKLAQIKLIKTKFTDELSTLYLNNVIPKNKKNTSYGEKKADYEARLLVSNQNIAAIQYYLNALAAQKMAVKADISYLQSPDTKNLQTVTDIYKSVFSQYKKIEKSMQQIEVFLTTEASVITGPALKKSLSTLQKNVKQYSHDISLQKQMVQKDLTEYQAKLKQLMSSRQSLAEYGISSWPIILKKIAAIPGLFYKYIHTLSLKVYDSYLWLDTFFAVLLWGSFALIAGLFFILSRFLNSVRGDKERSRLTGHLYDGVLILVQRNIPYLAATCMLWTLFYITQISFANYQLIMKLIVVWFTFRISILIARLVLLERVSDSSGKDVKLYYRLKWLLLFGGWTTALMMVGNLLPLSLLLQDIFNRLFMLFMLTVAFVAWRSKDVIRYLVEPLLTHKKRYVQNAVSILIVLVPITLFSTAIIGMSGFINLAWTMSSYQANTLLIIVGYIISRGLIFDALELFSEWMISSLRNGWLWIEVFLKPIDKILHIALFLLSTLILFQVYDWHSNSFVMTSLEKIAQYTIINLTGIHITVASTVEFLVLLAVFIWASKWTREFCYRWLYVNTKDVGIRNSLSVFSQYAVILIGGFVALHVLGFDFSGMSMIIGGLAVGMGFGLRDFASNIVGGIMLLIERPVREGDLITLGEYEGRVTHIGIRTMRVCSWDNMEVLIPNAETFNKPFTNWTHQDSIVRFIVPIKVSRADDPVMIQQLILDVLAIIPEIVPDPPVQVCLKKIDAALIEFEARYFINVQEHSPFEVKSKVLFSITAQFKAANIKPPIEPISVEFKEEPDAFVAKKQPTEERERIT